MSYENHTLQDLARRLKAARSNQPKVTLQEAQAQANRVMEAARHSPHRSPRSSNGQKPNP
jgi:hypothetical protein